MKDFTLSSLRGGATVVLQFHAPWPWPVPRSLVLVEKDLKDGLLVLVAEPTGRINVRLVEAVTGKPRLYAEQTTCPIRSSGPFELRMAFTWRDGRISAIHANGEAWLWYEEKPEEVPAEYIPKKREPRKAFDFGRENNLAFLSRRDTFAGSRPHALATKRGDRAYTMGLLTAEMLQINDLIRLINAGRLHHAYGLSARLRGLIVTGRPMPLLQICAAMQNAPLIVYTDPDPRKPEPGGPSLYGMDAGAISPIPRVWDNPVDLDVWLTLPTATLGGQWISNSAMLKKIGDTIGAHMDQEIHPSLTIMRSARSPSGPFRRSILIEYLCRVGATCVSLAQTILAAETKLQAAQAQSAQERSQPKSG